MSRYIYQGQFCDLSGNAVASGTIRVYLAGTTTATSVYTASSGGTAVNYVTSDSVGKFYFYIDDKDYNLNQKFKVKLEKLGFLAKTYDDITIFPEFEYTYYAEASATDQSIDANDNSIADLLAEIGTTDIRTIVCKQGTYTFSTTVDWSAYKNVTLKIQPGAVFAIDTGVTVTMGCNIDVGLFKWITLTGTGFLKPAIGFNDVAHAEWITTNTTPETTNMTTALQTTINMMSWIYGTVKMLSTTYLVSKLYFYYDVANNANYNSSEYKQAYINFIGSGAAPIVGDTSAVTFRDSKTIITSTSVVDAVLDLQEVSAAHLMNYTLKDFSIKATGVTSAVILADSLAKNSVIENVTIITSSGNGISISNIYLGAVKNVDVAYNAAAPVAGKIGFNFNNSLRNGQVYKFEKLRAQTFETGFYFEGNALVDGQMIIENLHVKNCTYGIHLKKAYAATIQGCMLGEGDITVNAIILKDCDGVIVQGNRNRALGDIILLDGVLDFIIQGNVHERPASPTAGSGGITAVAGSTVARGTIQNNNTGAGTDCYGIILNSARGGVNVINNYTAGTALAPIDDETYAHLYITQTDGLVTQKTNVQTLEVNSATPDISAGTIFKTANTVATTITDFLYPVEGKRIVILIKDANTTFDFNHTTGNLIYGNAGVDWTPTTNDWMECIYDLDNTNWYCSVHDCTA